MSDWIFTAHACRHCLGRVMASGDTFRCAVCDAEVVGAVEALCGCGLAAGAHAQPFRCGPNPARGPANPAVIAILYGDVPDMAQTAEAA